MDEKNIDVGWKQNKIDALNEASESLRTITQSFQQQKTRKQPGTRTHRDIQAPTTTNKDEYQNGFF